MGDQPRNNPEPRPLRIREYQYVNMEQTVTLRSKPKLKITLKSNGFEIVDRSDPNNSGNYLYQDLKNVKLNAEKTDWLVSLFSLMVGIFVSSSIQGNFKNKANLQLEMIDRNLKIWLVDADFQKVENISQLLTEKKTSTKQYL